MQTLHIRASDTSPEIFLSPQNNSFFIRGNSAPEDVRALFYPINEWIKSFIDEIIDGKNKIFNNENPFKFQVDLLYFNSSSAKFLYDILLELKRLIPSGIPVIVEWIYEEGDSDMREAGVDISILAGFDFHYISKKKTI